MYLLNLLAIADGSRLTQSCKRAEILGSNPKM